MSPKRLSLELGVKSDPIEYRYSFEWLFDLMAEEGVHRLQLGTFFEIYRLPDSFFVRLRREAETRGIRIASVFTSHRELGGCFRDDCEGWHEVGRAAFERLIEVGALVGARTVGCNPGAVLRDRRDGKAAGTQRYLDQMKGLMRHAKHCGLEALTMEPMSCLAEPPTLPTEIVHFAAELAGYHDSAPEETVPVGYCADVSHGYVDGKGRIVNDHWDLLEAGLPWTRELHLRNTDAAYGSTFGFGPEDLERGIVNAADVRRRLLESAGRLPVQELVGYLEVPGPKLGRDYSDPQLGDSLRSSLRHLKGAFLADSTARGPRARPVRTSPSIMCADMGRLAEEVARLEKAGADMIHVDLMDAHFVPTMPLGMGAVAKLRELTKLPLDVHLMVEDNDRFMRQLVEIGVDRICVHAETATHLHRTLSTIRQHGISPGIALCPATPLGAIDYVADAADFLLLMTVDPGFAGQPLVPTAMKKIAEAHAWRPALPIEVDGNVSFENIPEMVARGASELVLGSSSLFAKGATYRDNMARVQDLIDEGLERGR